MGSNFESHYFWGFSEKIIFWGYEDFVDIFGGSSPNWTIFRSHFYVFYGLFLRSSYRMVIFFGLRKFQIFFMVLEIPDFFFWGGGGEM